MEAHREIHFEDYIVDYLGSHGWRVGDAAKYDRTRALYPEDVTGYLRESQPDVWQKLGFPGTGDLGISGDSILISSS
jgi:type I restriction enzyme R subunit